MLTRFQGHIRVNKERGGGAEVEGGGGTKEWFYLTFICLKQSSGTPNESSPL